jgi:hypothetical protein
LKADATLKKVNPVALSRTEHYVLIVRDFFQPGGKPVVPGENVARRKGLNPSVQVVPKEYLRVPKGRKKNQVKERDRNGLRYSQ